MFLPLAPLVSLIPGKKQNKPVLCLDLRGKCYSESKFYIKIWEVIKTPPLSESLLYANFFFFFYRRPTSLSGFTNWRKSKEKFHFHEKRWKVKTASSICFVGALRGQGIPWVVRLLRQPPSCPGTILSIPASSLHSLELSMHLHSLCASQGRTSPKVSALHLSHFSLGLYLGIVRNLLQGPLGKLTFHQLEWIWEKIALLLS